ncbi:MAG: HEAT repeat domain-containing protein [Sedimentisphaerales bacterium]
MKAVKIAAIAVVTAVLLIGTANVAMARTNVSVGVGIGFPGFYGGYYHGGYSRHYGSHWGHRYPYRSEIFIGGPIYGPGYYDPYYYPGYYVVDPPPVVVERQPVVIEQQPTVYQPQATQPQVAQPQGVDENTQKVYKDLRYKKSELMRKLETGDKDSQIQAIRALAGFSFDDNVRQAIENVLSSNTDAQMRLEAAQSLGSVKNTKALPALEKARVDDGDADVRRAADAAIKNIEGK